MICLQPEGLEALASDEMSASERDSAVKHLETCARCRRALEQFKRTDSTQAGVAPNQGNAVPAVYTKFGPYLVLEMLGEGGMGSVFTAYHPELDRKVAVKVLRPATSNSERSTHAHARLMREAQSMAQLDHPNVMAIHDVGSVDGQVYLVMDRVDGVNLSEWLKAAKRDWREIVKVMVQAGRGLAAAHDAGIVHRDFKPANVLVGNDGRVRVADFGLARKNVGERTAGDLPGNADVSSSSEVLTQAGIVSGTPGFMAPEQFAGEVAGPRSDQFSFCVSLYEALFGMKPYPSIDGRLTIERFMRPPLLPSKLRVPGFICDAVMRGLSVDPARRFEHMHGLITQLERQPLTLRVIAPWFSIAAVIAVSLVAGWWLTRPPRIAGCEASEVKLAATWNEEAQRLLERAFQATGAEGAGAASAQVIAGLDRYAGAWSERQSKTCASALGAPNDSPLFGQLKCLELQRMNFQAVVEVLSHPAAGTISRAALAPESLMPPSRCEDPRALSSLPRTPSDAGLREKVQALRFQLVNASALNLAGQPARALEALTPVVSNALALKYPPFEAEAHQALGETNAILGNAPQATEQFHLAARAAEVTGQDALAANANASEAFFAAYSGQREAAQMMIEHAQVLLERAGGDPLIESQIENTQSLLSSLGAQIDQLLIHQRRSVELRRQVLGPTHPRTLQYLSNLAQAQIEHCDPAAAVHELKVFDSLEAMKRAPSVYVTGMMRLAQALTLTGDVASAERLLVMAKSLLTPADRFSRTHAEWAFAKSTLQLQTGDAQGALESANEALDATSQMGPESAHGVVAREAIAAALTRLGRGAEAAMMLERELPLHQKILGDDLKSYSAELAEAYLAARQFSKAAAAANRALEEQNKSCATPGERAAMQWVMARALSNDKREAARSKTLASSAREIFATMPWRRQQLAEIDQFLGR